MRVLSAQEIQYVSGSASTAAAAPKSTGSSYNLGELFSLFFVGLYLVVTGKSITSLY